MPSSDKKSAKERVLGRTSNMLTKTEPGIGGTLWKRNNLRGSLGSSYFLNYWLSESVSKTRTERDLM